MSYIEEALTDWFGERCPEFHPECHMCRAWAEYDGLKADWNGAIDAAVGIPMHPITRQEVLKLKRN